MRPTGYAAKKVKVAGKDVAGRAGKSVFRKSAGDEAGVAAKKGIVTHHAAGDAGLQVDGRTLRDGVHLNPVALPRLSGAGPADQQRCA